MTTTDLSVADRLMQVLDHLGIERAHFAASMLADVTGFAQAHPERIASLTLVCPPRLDPSSLRALGARLVVIAGDQGRPAAMVRDAVTSLPEAKVVWLPGYFSPPWADVVADCSDRRRDALLNVISRDEPRKDSAVSGEPQGTVAGISYHSRGEGTPLVLLPISLASSQWEPLLVSSRNAVSDRHAGRPGPGISRHARVTWPSGRLSRRGAASHRYCAPATRRGRPGSGLWVGSAGSLARPAHLAGQPDHWRRRQPISSPRGHVARHAGGSCRRHHVPGRRRGSPALSRTTMWTWRCRLRF